MAITKTNFFQQSLNQMAPNRVRGELADWGLSAQVVEVQIDSTQSTPLYSGDAVKIVSTSTGKIKVVAAGATDAVYGLVIYNSKREAWKAGDIVSVLRDGGVMSCVAANETVNAGAPMYYVPSDGSVTAVAPSGALPFGVALAKVVAPATGALVMVEVIKYSCLPDVVVTPTSLISSDATNTLGLGTDNKLFVAPTSPAALISADAANALIKGTDDKLFVTAA